MKNKFCFKLFLITFITGSLCSCNDNFNNFSGENNSSHVEQNLLSEVNSALKNINKGFKLKVLGTIIQTEEVNFQFDYDYLNETEEGFHSKLSYVYKDNPSDIVFDETYFRDEEGKIYQETLGLDNLIKKTYDNDYLYDNVYINPFSLLNENDFTSLNNGKYNVNLHKMAYVLDKFFPNGSKITSATMTIEDKKFVSLEIESEAFFEEDNYISEMRGTFSYDDIELNHLQPLPESGDQKKLSVALANVGNSYVIDFIDHQEAEHQKIYLSGKSIFVQHDFEADEIDEWQDSWWNTVEGESGLIELYYIQDSNSWGDNGNSYDDYTKAIPQFNIISGALFNYEKATNLYQLSSEYADIVAGSFVPKMLYNSVGYESNLTIEINLNDNNQLEKVCFLNENIDIEMVISSFDSLPFNLVDEAVTLS